MTSVGGVARIRAGDRVLLVREGDLLSDGEVASIDFSTPTVAWARFDRHVSSSPGVPYRPVVWLLAADHEPARSNPGAEEPANLVISESSASSLEAHRLDDEYRWDPFPPWTWGLTVKAAPRLLIELLQVPEPRAPSELLDLVVELTGGGRGKTWIRTEPGFGVVYFRFTSRESMVHAVAGELGVVAPSLLPPKPSPVFRPPGRMMDVALAEASRAGSTDSGHEAEIYPRRFSLHSPFPDNYAYDPRWRRDPFLDLSATLQQVPDEERRKPSGVPGLLIDDLEIGGLFQTPYRPLAEVFAFGRSFALGEGDQLWDGDVVRIDVSEGLVAFKQSVWEWTAAKPFRQAIKRVDSRRPAFWLQAVSRIGSSAASEGHEATNRATASRKIIDPAELATIDEVFQLEEEALNRPPIYDYDPAGRRDPFSAARSFDLGDSPVLPAESVPSALAKLTCHRLTHIREDDLVQLLERAEERLESYRWDRRLAASTSGRQQAWSRRFLAEVERATSQDLARWFGDLHPLESVRAILEPPAVEMFALLGDLNLIAGRFAAAAESYRLAEELSAAYEPLCGRLHEGRLYGAESFFAVDPEGGPGYPMLTGYLLAWDLDSGRVLERHLLPALPEAISAEGGALEISVTGAEELRLIEGRLEPPVRVLANLSVRSAAVWSSAVPALNFIGQDYRDFASPFAVGRRLDDRLPVTLPELEQALRAAAARDPTQPWYSFWLGQTRWAQGQHEEAESLWREMWHGAPRKIPYYELLWMAAFHEGYGQDEWADRGFSQALEARRRLGVPIFSAHPVERHFNAAAFWLGAATRRDPDRRYLWWRRLRQLSGQVAGDAFSAALWADFFERRGDRQGYRSALAELEEARAYDVDHRTAVAWLDYALYLAVAVAAMLFAQLAALSYRRIARLKSWRSDPRRLKLRWLRPWRLKWPGKVARINALRVGGGIPVGVVALYLALSLSALAASYVVYLKTEPFELSDLPPAGPGSATHEERLRLDGVDLLRAWLTTGVVDPANRGHGPLISRVQDFRIRPVWKRLLLALAMIGAMFVAAMPAALLLVWRRARDAGDEMDSRRIAGQSWSGTAGLSGVRALRLRCRSPGLADPGKNLGSRPGAGSRVGQLPRRVRPTRAVVAAGNAGARYGRPRRSQRFRASARTELQATPVGLSRLRALLDAGDRCPRDLPWNPWASFAAARRGRSCLTTTCSADTLPRTDSRLRPLRTQGRGVRISRRPATVIVTKAADATVGAPAPWEGAVSRSSDSQDTWSGS